MNNSLFKNIGIISFVLFYFSSFFTKAQVPEINWERRVHYRTQDRFNSVIKLENSDIVAALYDQRIIICDSIGNLKKDLELPGIFIHDIIQDPAGGYFAIGYDTDDETFIGHTAWVARLDDTLRVIWEKNYGGDGASEFVGGVYNQDGDLLLAGTTNSLNGDLAGMNDSRAFLCWAVKLNRYGDILWSKLYGNNKNILGSKGHQTFRRIFELSNKDIVFLGKIVKSEGESDEPSEFGNTGTWLVRTDSMGNIKWKKAFGGDMFCSPSGAILGTDDNIFIISSLTSGTKGVPFSERAYGFFVGCWFKNISLNDGAIIWSHGIGNLNNNSLFPLNYSPVRKNMLIDIDGHLVIPMYIEESLSNLNVDDEMGQTFKGKEDSWIVKMHQKTGKIIWHKLMGGKLIDRSSSVFQEKDNTLTICGYTTSKDGDVSDTVYNYGTWYVNLNNNPLYEFEEYDTICSGDSIIFFEEMISQSGTYHKYLKTSFNTDSIYTLHLQVSEMEQPELSVDSNILSIVQVYDSIACYKDNEFISNDSFVVMTDSGASYHFMVYNEWGCSMRSDDFQYIPLPVIYEYEIYPNPFHNELTIRWSKMEGGVRVMIYNVEGKKMFDQSYTTSIISIATERLTSGTYFIKIKVADELKVEKMVKL